MSRDTASEKECILQNKLCLNPTLIEDNLSLIERETVLIIDGRKHKPDILYKDNNNNRLFVEVKLKANEKTLDQVIAYKSRLSEPNVRYMIVADEISEKCKEMMQELNVEHRTIQVEGSTGISKTDALFEVPKGNRKFNNSNELLDRFTNRNFKVAEQIYQYVNQLHKEREYFIFCNISDGIMFQRVDKGEKFLTLTSIRDRLLFHIPSAIREEFYKKYSNNIPWYKAGDASSQIDLMLNTINVSNIEVIKTAIKDLYDNLY